MTTGCEDILKLLWHYGANDSLRTTDNRLVKIVFSGFNNYTGPEIIDAHIEIDGIKFNGDVVVASSSDVWQSKKYYSNNLYRAVVLFVTYEYSLPVMTISGEEIPVVVIPRNQKVENIHKKLIEETNLASPLCHLSHDNIDGIIAYNFVNSLAIERISRKADDIEEIFHQVNGQWNKAFNIMLFRTIGLNINKNDFTYLGKIFPMELMSQYKNSIHSVEALLFGLAGKLGNTYPDYYQKELIVEFEKLRQLHNIPLPAYPYSWNGPRSTPSRPQNSVSLRLAQLAKILVSNEFMMYIVLNMNYDKIIEAFQNITASKYWDYHYDLGDMEHKPCNKNLGDDTINLLMINLIAPFVFFYGRYNSLEEYKLFGIEIWEKCRPERNFKVNKWIKSGVLADTALVTQGFIQLYDKFCFKNRCAECRFGIKRIVEKTQSDYIDY